MWHTYYNMYQVFILQAYQTPGELLRISYWETVWQSPANLRAFIRWSLDQCTLASPSVMEASCYSALFCVFKARVRYNLEQRVFIYDCYVKSNSYKSCGRKFRHRFPHTTCPFGDITSKLMMEVRTHGILTDRKPLKRNCVLTEEKLDAIGHRLRNSPKKSFEWFCRQREDSN
jgi:hypothetical protein